LSDYQLLKKVSVCFMQLASSGGLHRSHCVRDGQGILLIRHFSCGLYTVQSGIRCVTH